MRPALFKTLLTFDDAKRRLLDEASPIDRTETVPLLEAAGRVAARAVKATIDVPPFDRSAMDGYAVRATDTAGATPASPRRLRHTGSIFTGDAPAMSAESGECIGVATGAPMPLGADAVVVVEATTREGDWVSTSTQVAHGQNVGRRGSDLAIGDRIAVAGDLLTPARVGALAAAGITDVAVYQQPRVGIASTGNELKTPGESLGPGQIYNVNGFTLDAIIKHHGGVPVHLAAVPDSLTDLSAALEQARSLDIVVFSGGSSVGERDLLVDAVSASGSLIFHGIAVRPGMPTLVGRVGDALVLGLSGYPTSCLSNAYLLLVPALRRIARLPPWQPARTTLPLARDIVSPAGRHQFYTVRIVDGSVQPAFKTSGSITSMANADGYIEIPADVDTIAAGTEVIVTLWGE